MTTQLLQHPQQQHHLVTVWNPSYEADAMDLHISLLLKLARECTAGKRSDDDVYVYWGKVRSPNRQAALPHLPSILELDRNIELDEAGEVHCYMTDYRSLYVAHIGGIVEDDLLADPSASDYIPEYYRASNLRCDFWFQLWDIRRLVLNDTPAVIAELAKLRNTRYNDRPVSIYGGMVDLPIIATRSDRTRWFDSVTRQQFTENRLWVEFDAERTVSGEMQRELRDNRFGVKLWTALEPATRGFIANAEYLYRTHRSDATFDLAPAAVDFAKAVEFQVNYLCTQILSKAPKDIRLTTINSRTVDAAREGPFTLGQLARILKDDRERRAWLMSRTTQGSWFVDQFPPILEMIAGIRNKAAHGSPVDREEVDLLRNQLIGIGCEGVLVQLAKVRERATPV